MATQAAQGTIARPRASTGLWREAFGRLRKNKLAMIGLVSVIVLFIIAIIGPYIAPYPYTEQDLKAVKSFEPLTDKQVAALLARTAKAAAGGKYERFKTTNGFDGTAKNPKWLGESDEGPG